MIYHITINEKLQFLEVSLNERSWTQITEFQICLNDYIRLNYMSTYLSLNIFVRDFQNSGLQSWADLC